MGDRWEKKIVGEIEQYLGLVLCLYSSLPILAKGQASTPGTVRCGRCAVGSLECPASNRAGNDKKLVG